LQRHFSGIETRHAVIALLDEPHSTLSNRWSDGA
jgi:hypothetical protein